MKKLIRVLAIIACIAALAFCASCKPQGENSGSAGGNSSATDSTGSSTAGGNSSSGGNVDPSDPYADYVKLSTVQDIIDLAASKDYNKFENKYCLVNDIDFQGAEIQPLGGWDNNDLAFNATFDGRGYALMNFKINNPENCKSTDGNYFGCCLFPFINAGTVKNLNLIGVNFTATGFVGGIAGKCESGIIENCFVQGGTVNSLMGYVWWDVYAGGIVGVAGANATINNCFIDINVAGGWVMAGVNFGKGSGCVARKSRLTLDNPQFQVDRYQNDDVTSALRDFTDSKLIQENELSSLANYTFTDKSAWTISDGYMAYLVREDGKAPAWAKLN